MTLRGPKLFRKSVIPGLSVLRVGLFAWFPAGAAATPSESPDRAEETQNITIPIIRRELTTRPARLWGVDGQLYERQIHYADGRMLEAPLGFQASHPDFEVRLYPQRFVEGPKQTTTRASRPLALEASPTSKKGAVAVASLHRQPTWTCETDEVAGALIVRTWSPEWQSLARCHVAPAYCPVDPHPALGGLAQLTVEHTVADPLLGMALPLCVQLDEL